MSFSKNRNNLGRYLLLLALAVGLTIAAGAASPVPQNSSQHKVLFEKAKFTMETRGDLKGAIDLFEEIIRKYPNEREYAAKSLYLAGVCYEKLGERQGRQAEAAFRKIVEDYPEQTEEVNLAKEKLLVFEKGQASLRPGGVEFGMRRVFPFGTFGSPSPDGRFFSCRDDSGDLVIIETATGKKRRLTNNASWDKGDFVGTSRISPDGRKVAYSWCRDFTTMDLVVAGIDGSGKKTLCQGKLEPRDGGEYFWPCGWTPDGQAVIGLIFNGEEQQIGFVSVNDASLRIVKDRLRFRRNNPEQVSLSPDGRWIAYDSRQADDTGRYDLLLMAADGSGEVPLVKHPADDRLLAWTRRGDSILFASDRSGSWDAWLVSAKNGKPQGDPVLIKRDFGTVGSPTGIVPLGISRDGSFYYEARSWMEEVQTAALDMEKIQILTPPHRVSGSFEGANCYADWSPDGKTIAFSSRRDGASALCFVSPDTGEHKEIFPRGLGHLGRINWHPDGNSVVAVGSRQGGGAGGIYRVDIESGTVTPVVTEGSGFHSPRCTLDGKYVFYEEDTSWEDKVFRIMRVDIETREKKEIYRSTDQIIRMDISPDGKSLAFLEAADSCLKTMTLSGGQSHIVYRFDKGWATSVAWSPDGRYLFFSRIPEGEGKTGRIELWRISSQGGEPVKFPLQARGMENLRFSPDGKRISFNTFEVRYETWVMENFLPKSAGNK